MPHARGGFTRGDLDAVLKRRGEWLDVDPDDLEALVRETEMQAYTRTFGQLSCADLMTKNAIEVAPSTSVTAALTLLDRHRVKALPVVDGEGRLTGIVTRADLTRPLRRPTRRQRLSARLPQSFGGQPASVATVMTRDVACVPETMPITALVPLFTHSPPPYSGRRYIAPARRNHYPDGSRHGPLSADARRRVACSARNAM